MPTPDPNHAARCPKCGYSLLGLPELRCPECGYWHSHNTTLEHLRAEAEHLHVPDEHERRDRHTLLVGLMLYASGSFMVFVRHNGNSVPFAVIAEALILPAMPLAYVYGRYLFEESWRRPLLLTAVIWFAVAVARFWLR